MRNFKKLLYFSLFIPIAIGISPSQSEGQSWVWAKQGICRGNYADVYSIATDKSGNIVETGLGWGRIIFGSDSTNPQNSEYPFVVKYDQSGNVLWAKNSLNNIQAWSNYIATDKSDNVYIAGQTWGTIVFDSIQLNRASECAFVACYTPAGNIKWAMTDSSYNSNSFASISCICTDKYNNVYATGYYEYTVFFGHYMLPYYFGENYFIVKLDSSGNVLWAKYSMLALYGAGCYGEGITTDDSGNIYVTANYHDSLTIGAFHLPNKTNNSFVAKYNPSGHVEWVQNPEPSGMSSSSSYAIAVDNSYNSYITGQMVDTVSFGSDTIRSKYSSVYISKLSPTGEFLWVKAAVVTSHQTQYQFPYSIAVNNKNQIFTCGTFEDTLNFSGIFLTSDSMEPSYILKLDSLGNGMCGTNINNYNDDQNAVGIDPLSNDIYFGGDYGIQECIFGTDTLYHILGGGEYSFLAKWQPCDSNIETSIPPISNPPSLSLFPNPSNGAFTLQVNSEELRAKSVEIYNVLGEKVYSSNYSLYTNHYSLNLSSQPSGIYLYRVIDASGALEGEGKFVIEK